MKYCTHCGKEIPDEAEICIHCGCRVSPKKANSSSGSSKVLSTIALVLMILAIAGCVFSSITGIVLLAVPEILEAIPTDGMTPGELQSFQVAMDMLRTLSWALFILCLLPLAWTIPMTVHLGKQMRNEGALGTAFKVCTLIFVNVIAGILLLCREEPSNN